MIPLGGDLVKIYVTEKDLTCINAALSQGADIRIQITKEGYRILADTVRVLKKGSVNDRENLPEKR